MCSLKHKRLLVLLGLAVVVPMSQSHEVFGQTNGDVQGIASPSAVPGGVEWSSLKTIGKGTRSSVAMNSSGWLIEVHESQSYPSTGLYYHVGKLNQTTGLVEWGVSRQFANGGSWPSVAITPEGYVILTRSDGNFKCCSDLDYDTGSINMDGGVNQEILFRQRQVHYDSGFHNGISVNASGVIVEVHESSKGELFHRQGHLKDPQNGEFTIEWTSPHGVKYDSGVDPNVSINNLGYLLEVHGVPGEEYLHYTRGALHNGGVAFLTEHPRYDNLGKSPSVCLMDNSSVLEVHARLETAYSRQGVLNPSDFVSVLWDGQQKISKLSPFAQHPSVACGGGWAVITYGDKQEKLEELYYAVAKLR